MRTCIALMKNSKIFILMYLKDKCNVMPHQAIMHHAPLSDKKKAKVSLNQNYILTLLLPCF